LSDHPLGIPDEGVSNPPPARKGATESQAEGVKVEPAPAEALTSGDGGCGLIIFGWGGGKVKNHGPALPQRCPSCGHEGFFHYFTVTKWLRLYFIPIIPYSTKHFLACPVCTSGTELTTQEDRQRIHSLVATTASLNSGLLSPDAYAAEVRGVFGETMPAPALPPTPALEEPAAPAAPSATSNRIRAGESWSG
jgi:hypothetical protein